MIFVRMGSSDELESAFAAMMQERPDAFTMTGDPFHQLHVPWIIDFLARHRLPAMYQLRENVLAGGLMSYGASSARLVSACRPLRAQDFARRQAGGLAGGAAGQIRSGGQPQDRKGTRLDDPRNPSCCAPTR